ncbi:MAG: flagellar biosynthetic protein FliR [Planctomycetota bacterium]|jgi:flagellar biosynthetic protein FliR
MSDVLELSPDDVQVFLLVFFRITGLMMTAPLFGGDTVPRRVRVLLSLVMAVLLFPLVDTSHVVVYPNLSFYFLTVLMELAVGLVLGFSAMLLFTAVQFAGQLVDQELGLSLANVIDPVTNQQISVVGRFKMFLGMVIWLLISGHHFVIDVTFRMFETVPVLGFAMREQWAMIVADEMMLTLFTSAFRLAAPAAITIFLVTLAMAFMARVVPEMNIFILGFTLRIVIGFMILMMAVGIFGDMFVVQSERHEAHMNELLQNMKAPDGGP